MILDACHSGIGRDAAGMAAEFERRVYLEAEGTATLASCRRGEVAYEYEDKHHGTFTYYLLEGLKGAARRKSRHFITFSDLNNYVTNSVKEWSIKKGLQQWPNASTQLVGDPPLIELSGQVYDMPLQPPFPQNPFIDTLAIRDADRFVVRGEELRRLTVMLQGGSVALLGEPRIGKSSLLRYFARTWEGKVIGPLNCQTLVDQQDFYESIAEGLDVERSDWRAIRSALKDSRVLLLLDELDIGPDRGLTHDDLARFRALCSSNPDFKIVTVSRLPLKDVFPDPGKGSPAYSFLQPFTLGPLSEAEARHLLSHPWAPDAPDFDAVACDELIAAAGYHPFKLQRAAFHRYEALVDPAYEWQTAFQRDMEHML